FGRKYCTYICSTMNWPLGSSFDIGPPGTRWMSLTGFPLTSAMRPPIWNEPMPRSTMSSCASAGGAARLMSVAIKMRRMCPPDFSSRHCRRSGRCAPRWARWTSSFCLAPLDSRNCDKGAQEALEIIDRPLTLGGIADEAEALVGPDQPRLDGEHRFVV